MSDGSDASNIQNGISFSSNGKLNIAARGYRWFWFSSRRYYINRKLSYLTSANAAAQINFGNEIITTGDLSAGK